MTPREMRGLVDRRNKEVDAKLDERWEHLDDTLRSNGWRGVIVPLLKSRCQMIEQKLARGKHIPEAEIRVWQAQYLMLLEMIDDPKSFFGKNI